MDVKEDLLDKIVCFSPISQDPATDAPDATSVAAEKQGKSVSVARANLGEQGLVGRPWDVRNLR